VARQLDRVPGQGAAASELEREDAPALGPRELKIRAGQLAERIEEEADGLVMVVGVLADVDRRKV
jgi:hypothetical protein